MKIVDLTQKKEIAASAVVAKNFFQRLRGLIGSPPLQKGEALWIPRCQGIHMWGMGYPIDAVFLDPEKTVIRLVPGVPVNSFGPVVWAAESVLELPAGAIKKTGIKIGDRLGFFERDVSFDYPAIASGNSFTSPARRGK